MSRGKLLGPSIVQRARKHRHEIYCSRTGDNSLLRQNADPYRLTIARRPELGRCRLSILTR